MAAGPCGVIVSWAEQIAGQAERKSGPGGARAAVGRRGENEPALGWCGPGRGEVGRGERLGRPERETNRAAGRGKRELGLG